jgi:hypothetical protein
MINRVPSGQAEGSTRSASSTTHAPSRMLPSVSIAWRQSSSWTSSYIPFEKWVAMTGHAENRLSSGPHFRQRAQPSLE